MKLPFLNKNILLSSFSSNSSFPSCHHQNSKNIDNPNPPPGISSSSINYAMENPPEKETIENVIRKLKPSKRLIFQRRGNSNSILEEASKREKEVQEEEEEGFLLLSFDSNDPYSDFKKSMEDMVKAKSLHHDWRSLEKLLFWFLKVNVKSSHKYIFAAFVDMLLHIALVLSKEVAGEPSSDVVEESPKSSLSSPMSFYTSSSSSDETSPTSVRFLRGKLIGKKSRDMVCCLSSLFDM